MLDYNPIILSLDDLSIEDALIFVEMIIREQKEIEKQLIWGVKINTLLIHDGAHLVGILKKHNIKVMADPKLFDISNTMYNSLKLLDMAGAEIVTVHASSNYKGNDGIDISRIAGVTVLTSFDEELCRIIYNNSIENTILNLALLAEKNNYGYIVCAPTDLELLKDVKLKKICPGVRPLWASNKHDQKRVTTPQEALKNGATYVVLGRPIIEAENPLDALLRLNEDLETQV
jgi:orotidine-5'-phosphate decarboxylase